MPAPAMMVSRRIILSSGILGLECTLTCTESLIRLSLGLASHRSRSLRRFAAPRSIDTVREPRAGIICASDSRMVAGCPACSSRVLR